MISHQPLQRKLSREILRQHYETTNNAVQHAETLGQLAGRQMGRATVAGALLARTVAAPLTHATDFAVGAANIYPIARQHIGLGSHQGIYSRPGLAQCLLIGPSGVLCALSIAAANRILSSPEPADGSRAMNCGRIAAALTALTPCLLTVPVYAAAEVLSYVSMLPKASASLLGAGFGATTGALTLPAALLKQRRKKTKFFRIAQAMRDGPLTHQDDHKLAMLLGCRPTQMSVLHAQANLVGASERRFSVYRALQNNLDLGDAFTVALGQHDFSLARDDTDRRAMIAAVAWTTRAATQWWTMPQSGAADLEPCVIDAAQAAELSCPLTLNPFDALQQPVAIWTNNVIHVFEYAELMKAWQVAPPQNPVNRQLKTRLDLRPVWVL